MRRHAGRGFTLVELLVGLAIGLVVAAAATTYVLAHLREDHAAAARTRLLRELRMAADVVAHDLRRAGYWSGAAPASWSGDPASAPPTNPHGALAPDAGASDAARFSYARAGATDDDALGFRLRAGVVEMTLDGATWQALTDAGTVVVTHFGVTPTLQTVPLQSLCARPCPAGAAACAPTQTVRSLSIEIHGRSAGDPRITASAQAVARLRNDLVAGACPA